jgi:glutamate carboxypeptidase
MKPTGKSAPGKKAALKTTTKGGPTAAAGDSKAICDWLASQRPAMLDLLQRLVNQDSGSYDKAGVNAAGDILKTHFKALGLEPSTEPDATFGEAIKVTLKHDTANDQRQIVLMGHRDTVFPKGEARRRPFAIRDGKAYGPGVSDMKSGLVLNAFVLEAFQRFGGHPGPLLALITSDEEIGSPFSRRLIEREARAARAVFNSEPGRPSGNVVSGRKGGIFMLMEVFGKAAHSGGAYRDGVSAIEELARKIQKLHRLTDLARGTTVNVGLVRGGQTVNTIAPYAAGEIDLRYVKKADREDALGSIRAIVENCSLKGTSGRLEIKSEFAPLEQSPASKRLFEFSGGCADSGFTAGVGCPTICAVGPVGGKAHTPEEWLDIESLVPRAQAMARAIMRLGEAGL